MKARGNSKALYLLLVLTTLCASLALAGPSFAASMAAPAPGAMENYCVVPPFIGTAASPLVMLMMQRDEKLWREAYDDLEGIPTYDANKDGFIDEGDTGYKHFRPDGTVNEYYGYFDPYKCYEYSTVYGRFEPSKAANDAGFCWGNYWSGNFLNWATMTRIDVIRKAFFGGKRYIDNPSGSPPAALERAFLPQDGHSFVKIFYCPEPSRCNINGLTPYQVTHINPKYRTDRITICNATLDGYGNPPVMRVARGDDYIPYRWGMQAAGWERWASNETWQCALKGEKTEGDDALRPGADDLIEDLNVRVVACAKDFMDTNNKTAERCRLYEQHGNYMPVGLVQEYGEDSSMFFGLMTGSYDRNKSGGVLRAQLSDFGDLNSSDVNRTTGQFTNLGAGVWPTLKEISIANYDYTTGTYGAMDDCPDNLDPFSDGQCSSWGNPLAEMYYEGLRYFIGKDTATLQYQGNDGSVKKPSMNLPSQTWNSQLDPYSKTNVEPCAEAFALVISDPYPSYDGDQLPKSALGAGIESDLPPALPELDVAALAREIGSNEGIHGKRWLVGNVEGGLQDNMCNGKTVSDLSKVKGICPLEPGSEGSYYLPALALYGQRTDLRPGFTNTTDGFGQTGNQNLTTYVVSLGGSNGELEVDINGSPIRITPACYNKNLGEPCTLLEFRHAYIQYTGSNVRNDVYYFSWDASKQGGDYDRDLEGQLWIRKDAASVHVDIVIGYVSPLTTDQLDIGYVVSGTTFDGVRYPIGAPANCTAPTHNWTNSDTKCKDGKDFFPGTSPISPPESPLWLAAKYGAFKDANENGIPDQAAEWDANGDGVPDAYFVADRPEKLESKLVEAFSSILNRVTSGTAASVLASGEGSGANIVQAVYYPRKRFFNAELSWLGSLHNYWYYVDPFFRLSTIREDTPTPPALYGDKTLNLTSDNIVHMYFDDETLTTKVDLYKDSDGNGSPDYKVGTKGFGDVSAIWRAGLRLWARDTVADPRKVYTVDKTGAMIEFSVANVAVLAPLMNVEDKNGDGNNTQETEDIIRYVLGEHVTPDWDGDGLFDYYYRSRVAGMDLNGDGDVFDTVNVNLFGEGSRSLSEKNVWKLGDIVDSTPKIASFLEVNDYDQPPPIAYGDKTYEEFVYTPCTSSSTSPNYRDRGMVYVGANDGMLHAFKLGQHPRDAECEMDTMRLTGSNLGREEWAFIPRNALPYLKFLAEENYCHVNTIDLSPYLVDASVAIDTGPGVSQPWECNLNEGEDGSENCKKTVNSWRTILIGGMRFGGACDPKGSKDADGVESPVELADVENHGFSAYFALDVTEEGNPKFRWEFTDPDLGFSTTGPAVVRINGWRDDDGDFLAETPDDMGEDRMGRWFAVFGSGPTGPIDTKSHQFMGRSYKDLRLFVVDLWDGSLDRTIEGPDLPMPEAFAGSMLRATVDTDKDYSDDVLYIGYTKYDSTEKAWTKGGVGRLITNESVYPDQWVWSLLIDNIGPVTSSPTKIFEDGAGKMWVYPATGRYFYKLPKELDDEQNRRMLLGLIDKCITDKFFVDFDCIDPDTSNDKTIDGNLLVPTNSNPPLADATTVTDLAVSTVIEKGGWFIRLQDYEAGTGFGAERVVTDVEHSSEGWVFYTSFKPYNGACVLGGQSYLWIVNYDNGGAPGAGLKGKALVQVSTGAIEEIDLRDALNHGDPLSDDEKGAGATETYGRRSLPMEGVPPVAQGLSLMTAPAATSTIIHFKER